ncbi:hypothetical protein, variant 1 [Aphanomyces astaci]|uniref:EF-hand domain-containing protein n=2 Tax=Aphanomyces astaci TaxID=112090 RepID=W4FM71_APHAT|nr:hypothetical protein, variant 1 [Aphanomyces astaci]ETV67924.1 hypothetical protein, variant 1 [Aphanomyces astaci]|eukprot:XP_009842486.1 hypothetical protein, variant 1 [Aphanomyces astaci]
MPETGHAPQSNHHTTIALLQHLVNAKQGGSCNVSMGYSPSPRGKRLLQEQLNQIGHEPPHRLASPSSRMQTSSPPQQQSTTLQHPTSPRLLASPRPSLPQSTYERERKESLFKMQIRQVDEAALGAPRPVTNPTATTGLVVPSPPPSSTLSRRTSHKTLLAEVGAANKASQARFSAQEVTHAQQITHDVLCRSLAEMRNHQRVLGQPTPGQTSTSRRQSDLQMQLHQTHELALHRVRHGRNIPRTSSIAVKLPPHGFDDADVFHVALQVAEQHRDLRKLSNVVQRQNQDHGGQTVVMSSASLPPSHHPVALPPSQQFPSQQPIASSPSSSGGFASPRRHSTSPALVTLDLQHHYFQVMSTLHPDRKLPTNDHSVVVTGNEWLSIHEFIPLFCLTFAFSNTEWAAKCFPAYFASKQQYDKSPKLTLVDFAAKCRMLTNGADVDKARFVFSIYDHDRSGTVEVDEVFQTLQSDKEDLWDQVIFSQQLMGLVNPNHDGTMGFQDFCTACQKIPMFFTCFTGPLPVRLSMHPENVKYRLGLNAIRKMWSCGVKESTSNDNHDAIDSAGFKTVISYFFRFARSSAIDQALATRLFQSFSSRGDVVYFGEFIAGMSTLIQGTVEARGRMMHAVLDLDRGGTVTKNEIQMILRSRANILQHQEIKDLHLERNANEIMRALDENGDGDISVDEFMAAVRRTPHVLEALQDILFSGCRLESDFDTDAWKTQTQKGLDRSSSWHRNLDEVVAHPDNLMHDFKKIFVTAVKKVSAATTIRRRNIHHKEKPPKPAFPVIVPSLLLPIAPSAMTPRSATSASPS